jgi:hypothetical protein
MSTCVHVTQVPPLLHNVQSLNSQPAGGVPCHPKGWWQWQALRPAICFWQRVGTPMALALRWHWHSLRDDLSPPRRVPLWS